VKKVKAENVRIVYSGRAMSDQAQFFILKRELDSIRRQKWFVIILLWIIVLISQFYLNLDALVGTIYGFIVGATLATAIWLYYTKKERQILNQIAQLNI
jgi:hypothetical protein